MIANRNPQMKKAVGVLKELSADERTRMLYEEREKARRDIASMMDGAKEEGKAEGRVEGRVEGKEEERSLSFKSMVEFGIEPEQIASRYSLPIEKVMDYLSQ